MKLRVLVLDDNDLIRSLLTTILEGRGYEVITYSEPALCPIYSTGGTKCTHKNPCVDIIISDVRMPGLSGIDFVEKITGYGCRVKDIAFISGSWSHEEYQRAERLKAKLFFKPFNIEALEMWLDECEKTIRTDRVLSEWYY